MPGGRAGTSTGVFPWHPAQSAPCPAEPTSLQPVNTNQTTPGNSVTAPSGTARSPHLGSAHFAVPSAPGRPTPTPRPGQRTPKAVLGSLTADRPGARVAGSIPRCQHPRIRGVPRCRWPQRAGRRCVVQSSRRRSLNSRLDARPPAQPLAVDR